MNNYQVILLTTTDDLSRRHRPLGAYSLASVLRSKGIKVLVIDMFQFFSFEEMVKILTSTIDQSTVLVGWSTTFFFSKNKKTFFPGGSKNFNQINQLIKKINPDTKIILGGAPSYQFVEIVKKNQDNYGVEYVVHGYSEGMILDIFDAFQNKTKPKFFNIVQNIYEINYDVKGDLFNFRDSSHNWIDDDILMNNECLPLEVARGCIFKCKFCAYPLLGKDGKDLSYIKKEENLLAEILSNYEKAKILNYFIVDDTFNERTEKIEMMIKIRDRSKLNLNFVGYNRIDLIAAKPQQMYLLKELNFTGHFFGIESLNHPSSKIIGKGIHPDKVLDTLDKIKAVYQNKVSLVGGFIIGLPKESPETFMSWVTKITDKDSPMDTFNFWPLALNRRSTFTMSEFDKNPEKYGYQIIGEYSWKNEFWNRETCMKLANDITDSLVTSGRQRVSAYVATGLTKLGYDYFDMIKLPANQLPNDEIKNKFQEFFVSYKTRLMQHLDILI